MKKIFALLLILLTVMPINPVFARGGQSADDCPAGNKDPDCRGK
jgi:hypothetical protein